MAERHIPRVAILASGGGTTAEAFIHATQDGRVDAEVGLVVCNNPREKAKVWDRIDRLNAKYKLDIEIRHISGKTHPEGNLGRGQTLAEAEAICIALGRARIGHVVLMGYMKVVQGDLMDIWGWKPEYTDKHQAKMTNTHPGILPQTTDTFGVHASARVLELGLAQTAHTVHIVAPDVDEGPIIAEHRIDVLEGDTPQSLFDRVQAVEKAALPYALDRFLKEQWNYHESN